jgi:uncharacterized phosphosugar-binding protein/N-acetylglucosamine kinase-like BadF-type ATPase
VAELVSNTDSFIAIDAGGTHLRGFESVHGAHFAGSGVTHTHSLATDLAQTIVSAIPADVSDVETVVLSLAAIPQKQEDRHLLAAAIMQRLKFNSIVFVTDTQAAALSGKTQAELTIAVGTGITAFVQTSAERFELTGHGYLIGDEASGFWIGRSGLNAALRTAEGLGPETALLQAATDYYKCAAESLADYLHQLDAPVTQIASFAPIVASAAHNGDQQALLIIEQAAEEITSLIKAGVARGKISTVALIGGAIPHGEILHRLVIDSTRDLAITFVEGTEEPLAGACRIAQDGALQKGLQVVKSAEINADIWSTLYLLNAQALVGEVAVTQHDAVAQCVQLFADALSHGKMIHTFGTGHSHLLAEEIFYRAGGLATIYPILDERLMLHKDVVTGSHNERLPGLAQELLDKHPVVAGDVVIVISNSGGNQVTIDLLNLSKAAGAKVVALTSVNHATSGSARSNAAQKIHQLADVVLDNSGVVGDASVRVAGSVMSVGPTSTVVGGALLQSIVVGTVAELIKRGVEPEIFLSSNLANGDENNAALFDKYRSLIDLYN